MARRRLTLWLAALAGATAIVVTSAQGAPTRLSCPPRLTATVHSSRPGAEHQLVPSGANNLILCRYDGPFGSPGQGQPVRLVAIRTVPHPQRLAAAFDRLPLAKAGTYACPLSTGAAIIAEFGYSSGAADPVRVDLTGCQFASNGHLTAFAALNGNNILNRLEALDHALPSRTGTGRATAAISGFIRLCGGPAPGRCFISTVGGCNQHQGCVESDRVVAIDTEGRQVAEQKIRIGRGRFRLDVAPGDYVVELLADGRHVHDRLLRADGATARAGHTSRVVFTFDVP